MMGKQQRTCLHDIISCQATLNIEFKATDGLLFTATVIYVTFIIPNGLLHYFFYEMGFFSPR